jgi:hypothetical protein
MDALQFEKTNAATRVAAFLCVSSRVPNSVGLRPKLRTFSARYGVTDGYGCLGTPVCVMVVPRFVLSLSFTLRTRENIRPSQLGGSFG